MSDTFIQSRLQWTSKAFLGYLYNALYKVAVHTNALHIPASNLPILTNEYKQMQLPSDGVVTINPAPLVLLLCKSAHARKLKMYCMPGQHNYFGKY